MTTKAIKALDATGHKHLFRPGLGVKSWNNEEQTYWYGDIVELHPQLHGATIRWLDGSEEYAIPFEQLEVLTGRGGRAIMKILKNI